MEDFEMEIPEGRVAMRTVGIEDPYLLIAFDLGDVGCTVRFPGGPAGFRSWVHRAARMDGWEISAAIFESPDTDDGHPPLVEKAGLSRIDKEPAARSPGDKVEEVEYHLSAPSFGLSLVLCRRDLYDLAAAARFAPVWMEAAS